MKEEIESTPSLFFKIAVFVFLFVFIVGFMIAIYTVFAASVDTMMLVAKWYCIAVMGVILAAAPVWLIESKIQRGN